MKDELSLCTLFIARHGQTEWNVKKIIQGHSESVLTERGKQQARELHRTLQDIHFDAIFSSDLLRAKQTAEIIALEKKLAVTTTAALRERKWGKYEGRKSTEYQQEARVLLEKFNTLSDQEKWQFRMSVDMETDEEVVSRFIQFVREIAVAYRGKTVLVVTHGGCIRTFLTRLGYMSYGEFEGMAPQNAGYMKVLSDGIDFFLKEQHFFQNHNTIII